MSLWPSRISAPVPPPATEDPAEVAAIDADMGIADTGPAPPRQRPAPSLPSARRPPLSRQGILPPAPNPPSKPAPPSPAGAQGLPAGAQGLPAGAQGLPAGAQGLPAGAQGLPANPQIQLGHQTADSLSLAQLRCIVTGFPQPIADPVAYDFEYDDKGPHEEEIDEWFIYQTPQWVRLSSAHRAFQDAWGNRSWDDADDATRWKFIQNAIGGITSPNPRTRRDCASQLVYIILGRWEETAGGAPVGGHDKKKTDATVAQIQAIREGVSSISHAGGIPAVWEQLRKGFESFWSDEFSQAPQQQLLSAQDELINLLTIMYLTVHETLHYPNELASTKKILRNLRPSLVDFMLLATANMRWDDQSQMPQTQVLLLFWKSLLFTFGGTPEIKATKKAVQETESEGKSQDVITASPLDYHVFRQEITSKYPAYVPPQPKLPLASEQTSYLPRLPNHPTRDNGSNGIYPAPQTNRNTGGASILYQPVHIATPAPSPPPSPGVGGKGGKKQNYQTNQNFPFMYPPLDATSNSAGGKGMPEALEKIVGRKWEGSDIPASILEAGELFYKRVRMTRATRQLWEEREKFLEYERGFDTASSDDDDSDIDSLDLNLLTVEERELIGRPLREKKEREDKHQIPDVEVDFGPNLIKDERIRERLIALENFYRNALPHLQSLVIVFHKTILNIVTSLINSPLVVNRSQENGTNSNPNPQPEPVEHTSEELDTIRTREISGKAATGIVILLLKWLKTSHILKFEYMTQLLLDANFVPLILKFIAHQDVQYMVDTKNDRLETSFFHVCNMRGRASEKAVPKPEESSEDEACPPPIKRQRSPDRGVKPCDSEELSLGSSKNGDNGSSNSGTVPPPEVDELGYPVNPLPKEPITDYSWRNFFTLINFLRILQKVCKNKVHRNMLLVQYKSSSILRKALKVPQQDLRLYTLKLFKNQVPYCGRKWRQGNMRVITAVYLHCRPELRDEWLAGSDVDAEVEEAVPLEQALRSLTHFFNNRRYLDKTVVVPLCGGASGGAAVGDEGRGGGGSESLGGGGRTKRVSKKELFRGPGGEWGFFVRELEKMDWFWGGEEDGMGLMVG